ncbi:tryptophan synthase subunit alpha [Enterococcus malodoratus]|uniref:tryptophan synthase subunit alpha n=1 Tax=Enterococcus malodoratus TaxID=71451 RepID=UPI003FD5283A
MKNLVLYLTINYPTRQTFFEILDVVEEFKTGYVEIGIPVADPYLDGAIVRESQEKVFPDLTMDEITSVLTEIRERYSFKIILMTYNEGVESFKLEQLSQSTYDAILCVDKKLDTEKYPGLVHTFSKQLDKTAVASQLSQSSQFIYLVSGEGKTGEFDQLPNDYIELLPYVKKNTDLPVFVGFGVKDPEDIASILANGADGAIIGSEFIKRFNQGGIASLKAYLTEIRTVY